MDAFEILNIYSGFIKLSIFTAQELAYAEPFQEKID